MKDKISLRYGDGEIEVELDSRNLQGYIIPCETGGSPDKERMLREAITPKKEMFLKVVENKRVLLLLADHTRDEPHLAMAQVLLELLSGASRIHIVLATGSHSPKVSGNEKILKELQTVIEKLELPPVTLGIHDAYVKDWWSLGQTSRGTPIEINPVVKDAEVICIASDMKPHYFAGYSNALKYFLPGLASYAAIEKNHSYALSELATFGRHPLHPNPNRRQNPLAEDMLEFTQRVVGSRPVWVLTTIATQEEIYWAYFDEYQEAIRKGIEATDRLLILTCQPADYVVISCGGYPNDESLYTAQRALELTQEVVRPQGYVLWIAECRNGIAPTPTAKKNFYDPLHLPLPQILKTIEKEYILYAHKAYKMALYVLKMKEVWLYSALPQIEVESIHLAYASHPQSVVDRWLKQNPDAKILFMDYANKLALLPNQSS